MPNCIRVGLQSKGKEVGRCYNEYSQTLSFDSDLSKLDKKELFNLASKQFPYYGIESVTVNPNGTDIVVVYRVDSSD